MKRIFLTAVAVAIPVGALVTNAGVASAAVNKIDVSQDSVACTLRATTLQLSPKLTTNLRHRVNMLMALELKDCVVSGPDAANLSGVHLTGAAIGVLHASTVGVTGIPATLTTKGKMIIQWSAPGGHLLRKHSKLTIGSVTVSAAADGNAAVAIGNTSVTGDFGGADGGATSALNAETTQSLSTLQNEISTTGLHSVRLTGSLSLG